MTKDEAIRIIKIVLAVAEDFEITVQGEEFTEEKCKEAVDMAVEALSSSEKPEQKWISVNQPPEASGRYIVTRHFFDNDFVEMANYSTDLHTVDKYNFPKHKAGWYNDDSEYGLYELDDIVAWMSRPESFKGN